MKKLFLILIFISSNIFGQSFIDSIVIKKSRESCIKIYSKV